jgi:hypothetical protein
MLNTFINVRSGVFRQTSNHDGNWKEITLTYGRSWLKRNYFPSTMEPTARETGEYLWKMESSIDQVKLLPFHRKIFVF